MTLIFAAPRAPLAQPWNVIAGNTIGGLVGVCVAKIFGEHHVWLAAGIATATAIAAMMLAQALHPPGGATALIAVTGSKAVHDAGFLYVVVPAFTSSVILVAIGVLVNNWSHRGERAYPVDWHPRFSPIVPPLLPCCGRPAPTRDSDRGTEREARGNNGGTLTMVAARTALPGDVVVEVAQEDPMSKAWSAQTTQV